MRKDLGRCVYFRQAKRSAESWAPNMIRSPTLRLDRGWKAADRRLENTQVVFSAGRALQWNVGSLFKVQSSSGNSAAKIE
jgi:hypothetical protein